MPVNDEMSSWSVDDVLEKLRERQFLIDVGKIRGRYPGCFLLESLGPNRLNNKNYLEIMSRLICR